MKLEWPRSMAELVASNIKHVQRALGLQAAQPKFCTSSMPDQTSAASPPAAQRSNASLINNVPSGLREDTIHPPRRTVQSLGSGSAGGGTLVGVGPSRRAMRSTKITSRKMNYLPGKHIGSSLVEEVDGMAAVKRNKRQASGFQIAQGGIKSQQAQTMI